MRRSFQEVIELIAFGLIALLAVMLVIWGAGWAFTFLGWLFRLIGDFIWSIMRFVVPVAIVALIVYFAVRLIGNQMKKDAVTIAASDSTASSTSPQAVTQASADDTRAVETRADDAEPVDVNVDTSGFKEMDDLAEEIEEENEDETKT